MMNPPFTDLGCEHRADPVPPKPYRFMADINAAFEQQVLDLPQGQRIPNVHHHRQADDLG